MEKTNVSPAKGYFAHSEAFHVEEIKNAQELYLIYRVKLREQERRSVDRFRPGKI